MKKYEYLTETIAYAVSRKKLNDNLHELLNKKANEGWRLFKFECADAIGACIVVFEREAEY